MDKFRFLELVKNTSSCNSDDEILLVQMTESFPYCQTAFVLLAKSSHDKGGMHADTALHAAAIRIPHREHLRKLLQAENTLKNLAYISAEKKNTEKFKSSNLNSSVMDSIDKKNNSLLEELEANLRSLQSLKKNAHFFDDFKIEKEIFIDVVPSLDPTVYSPSLTTPLEEPIESQIISILDPIEAEVVQIKPLEFLEHTEEIITNGHTDVDLQGVQNISEPILLEEMSITNELVLPSELVVNDISNTILVDDNDLTHYLFESKVKTEDGDFSNLRLEDTEMSIPLTEQNPIDVLLSYIDFLDKRRNGEEEFDAIEHFINNEPVLPKLNPFEQNETPLIDLASESSEISEDLITENLANILLKQNKKEKALEIYKKLSLKNPEKSAYFASKISEIENL